MLIFQIIDVRGNEGTRGRVFLILLKIKGSTQNTGQVRGVWGFSPRNSEKLTFKWCILIKSEKRNSPNGPLSRTKKKLLSIGRKNWDGFWHVFDNFSLDYGPIFIIVVVSRLPSTKVADQQRHRSRPFWPAVDTFGKHWHVHFPHWEYNHASFLWCLDLTKNRRQMTLVPW